MTDTEVAFIAGYGRSGSTLLDLLLGRADDWFSMGEFRLFWHARRDHWRCGCGVEVENCPVWSEVVTDAGVDGAAVLADLKTTLRVRRLPGLVAPPLLGHNRTAHDRAAAALGEVYRRAQERTGAAVLVDSSKDPLYGLLLCTAPGVRVHVIHLVRDSRVVAYSWQRSRQRPEIGSHAYMPLRSPFKTALDWDLRNGLTHVLRRRAASYTRLTYEALVGDPDRALADVVASVTGARREPHVSAVPTALDAPNHTVGGNPMRFATTALQIRADDEWRDAFRGRDRRLVTALTAPLLHLYGYR